MKTGITTALWIALLASLASAAPGDADLVGAAKSNNGAAVRTLLKGGANVNARSLDGSTALLWAAYYNDEATVKLLLGSGADPNAANSYGETALSLAAQNQNLPIAEALVSAGAKVTGEKPSGETVLMTAARAGSAPIVSLLLARGAPVNAKEKGLGQTALMWAAARRRADVASALVKAGANVNAKTTKGSTALHFAVQQRDIETAKILLDAGADINVPLAVRQMDGFTLGLVETLGGQTPFFLAIAVCRQDGPEYFGSTSFNTPMAIECPASEDIAVLILNRGVDPNASDGSRIPALVQAVHARMPTLVDALLARGANVNIRVPADVRQWTGVNRGGARSISPTPVGATPLLVAAWWNYPALMKTLIAAGADVNMTAEDGTTALMAAAGVVGRPPMGYSKAVKMPDMLESIGMLLDKGLDINAKNNKGQTPMHGAAKLRQPDLIRFLADKGARVNVEDANGDSPLTLAERGEYNINQANAKKSVELLRELESRP